MALGRMLHRRLPGELYQARLLGRWINWKIMAGRMKTFFISVLRQSDPSGGHILPGVASLFCNVVLGLGANKIQIFFILAVTSILEIH